MLPRPHMLLVVALTVALGSAACSSATGPDPSPRATTTVPDATGGRRGPSPGPANASDWSCGRDDGGRRWGLHCSPAELAVWRERARSGPYRNAGDVSENSPGDWRRIRARAEDFSRDPSAGRWSGPQASAGCVQQGDASPPTEESSALRDAAFVALVEEDRARAEAVREELLWAARQPVLDFSRRDLWCTDVLYDVNPGFEIANWLTKLLYAYDYLGPTVMSDDDVSVMDRWFADAAEFFQVDLEASFSRLFRDRSSSDRRLQPWILAAPCVELTYLGGPATCPLHQAYNNRKAAIARMVTLVGAHQRRPDFMEVGERFVEELLAYSVFPEGAMGEFERWSSDLPDLGWAYATQTLGAAVTIADALARLGDDSLFRFQTRGGALGTEGGPKSLRTTIHALGGYLDGTYDRYVGPSGSEEGDPRWRIDGVDEASGWYSVHDVIFALADRYLRDAEIRGLYTRTADGLPPYPEHPAGQGPHVPWTGDQGTFPGVLFMFGAVDLPYPGRDGPRP